MHNYYSNCTYIYIQLLQLLHLLFYSFFSLLHLTLSFQLLTLTSLSFISGSSVQPHRHNQSSLTNADQSSLVNQPHRSASQSHISVFLSLVPQSSLTDYDQSSLTNYDQSSLTDQPHLSASPITPASLINTRL